MTSAAVAIEIVAALSKKPRQTRGVLPGCAGLAATTTGGGEGGSGSGAEAVERCESTWSGPFCASSSRTKMAVLVQKRLFETASDRKSTRLNSSHLGISYAVF